MFARAAAAQQLAWLLRRLGYASLGGVIGLALPCISAAAQDPSPAVQRQGLWALHHLATGMRWLLPQETRKRNTVMACMGANRPRHPVSAAHGMQESKKGMHHLELHGWHQRERACTLLP